MAERSIDGEVEAGGPGLRSWLPCSFDVKDLLENVGETTMCCSKVCERGKVK